MKRFLTLALALTLSASALAWRQQPLPEKPASLPRSDKAFSEASTQRIAEAGKIYCQSIQDLAKRTSEFAESLPQRSIDIAVREIGLAKQICSDDGVFIGRKGYSDENEKQVMNEFTLYQALDTGWIAVHAVDPAQSASLLFLARTFNQQHSTLFQDQLNAVYGGLLPDAELKKRIDDLEKWVYDLNLFYRNQQ